MLLNQTINYVNIVAFILLKNVENPYKISMNKANFCRDLCNISYKITTNHHFRLDKF